MNNQEAYKELIDGYIIYTDKVNKFNSSNPVKPIDAMEFPEFPECASIHLILKICEIINNEIKNCKEFGKTYLIDNSGKKIKCITINHDYVIPFDFTEQWENILILDMSSFAKNSDVRLDMIELSNTSERWNSIFIGKGRVNQKVFKVDWRNLKLMIKEVKSIFIGKLNEINQ